MSKSRVSAQWVESKITNNIIFFKIYILCILVKQRRCIDVFYYICIFYIFIVTFIYLCVLCSIILLLYAIVHTVLAGLYFIHLCDTIFLSYNGADIFFFFNFTGGTIKGKRTQRSLLVVRSLMPRKY